MRIKDHSASVFNLVKRKELAARPWGPVAAVLLTIFLYFASQVAGGLLISIYPVLKGWTQYATEQWLISSAVAQFFLILFIEAFMVGGVLFLLSLRKLPAKSIGLTKPKLIDVVYALAGFGIYIVSYVVFFLVVSQIFPELNAEQKQDIGFETAREGMGLILAFCSLVILPPIAEEVVCRGFLFTGLRSKLTWLPAAIITSVLFAVAHLEFGNGAPLLWIAAIDTFVLSMVMSYLRETRGTLGSAIILHMLKNGIAFLQIFIFAAS